MRRYCRTYGPTLRLCLQVSAGAVSNNPKIDGKETKERKKDAGMIIREEGLGRRVPVRSAESEEGLIIK